ncbi:MAG TPA: HAMP domain-containing sensor histidine kinase [Candidatus Acidoferrales bacterium]|nr:HAMP domain-containing sensor histidine kinase [Candidatus Acidoferrales bacterium]
MSVRDRLARTVAIAILAAVTVFATVSVIAIDRALRLGFDDRLMTMAQAMATAVDVHHGNLSVDANDLVELQTLHSGVPFAILNPSGVTIAGETPPAQTGGLHFARAPVLRKGVAYGSVLVWQPDLWIRDFDRTAALVSLAVGVVLVVLGTLAARRAATVALAPLERLATLAERIEARDLSSRLLADGDDELGRLCASFDRMLDRLEAAFSRERRFVADASHELRAPLAVLRAETELAQRRERTNDEYRAALDSIAREALRLEELIDELLAAARSDIDGRSRESLSANELLSDVARRVEPAATMRDVAVRVAASDPQEALANRPTLERALLAIVHNAIGFARKGGAVELRAERDDASVRIEIADDGPGFSAEGLEHATERFWRGDAARPRGGTGLGLAIARTMVEANGGTLQLSNRSGGGALVSIVLARPFT